MKTITISSFKGGTAKTSNSLHLASALVKFHRKKVLLIDFDSQANLTAGLGFNPDQHDSLAPVLQGEKKLASVIQKTSIKNLDLIPADSFLERIEVTGSLAGDRYSHERLKKILQDAKYDYVIIDTPPSLCWLTESAMIAADECVLAATPEFYSVKGLERLKLFMEQINKRHPFTVSGIVLSFWNERGKSNKAFLELIETIFPGKVFKTNIRRDISVSDASIQGKPIFDTAPDSRAASDYRKLTKELLKRI
ncbi:MAG: ParA family protein [Candidatus Algichlamydia australiensis]|nr:ParA family protein [Chlamydiales bacterium]